MTAERFPIEGGHVLMFARSIGDPNPVYEDPGSEAARAVGGILAPPTFVMASAQFDPDNALRPRVGKQWFGSGRNPSGLQPSKRAGADESSGDSARSDRGAGSGKEGSGGDRRGGGGTGLHAEQHFEYHRMPRVGDVLTAVTRPGRQWEKEGRRAGRLLFAETVTEYRDQDGELVVTARSVGVRTERPAEV